MIGMFSFALTAYFVFLRTYVDETGIGSVGLFFAVYAAVAIIERIFFGRVPQRFGEHRTLYVALIMFAAGFVVLGTTSSTAGVALAGAMCGAGHGYAFPILTSMTVTRAPDADRGSAIAFFTSLFDVGLLVGGPILGAIIGARGYPAMFLFAGFAVFAGVLIFAVWDRSVMRPRAGVTSG
jgi:MFS family permease